MISSVVGKWQHFWFGVIDLKPLGLFRAVFGSALFLMYASRAIGFQQLFSNEGLLPFGLAKQFAPLAYQPLFYFFPENDLLLALAYGLFLILLLAFAAGFIGRRLCWLIFILQILFFQRNYMTVYGADLVSNQLLFALCFTNSHQYFSLRNRVFPRLKKLSWSLWDSMGVRMIQVQMCIIYAVTGIDKLKGSEWWDGTALWYVFSNSQITLFDMTFMSHFPLFIVFFTWMTIVFEIYFAVMVWLKPMKKFWLFIGLMMHGGIAVFMCLPFFAVVMVSTYTLFLKPQEIPWFGKKLSLH